MENYPYPDDDSDYEYSDDDSDSIEYGSLCVFCANLNCDGECQKKRK